MLESVKKQYTTTHHHSRTQSNVHLRTDARSYYNSDEADRVADEKLSGKYNVRKICKIHYIALSVNGSCIECNE